MACEPNVHKQLLYCTLVTYIFVSHFGRYEGTELVGEPLYICYAVALYKVQLHRVHCITSPNKADHHNEKCDNSATYAAPISYGNDIPSRSTGSSSAVPR